MERWVVRELCVRCGTVYSDGVGYRDLVRISPRSGHEALSPNAIGR